jgi:hypothetical protein
LCRSGGALLFFASLIEYDKRLYESDGNNRTEESLELFDNVVHSEFIRDREIVLVFTGTDLLQEKLQHVRLSRYFPEFIGETNVNAAMRFMAKMFLQRNRTGKKISVHFVNCMDVGSVMQCFNTIGDFVDHTPTDHFGSLLLSKRLNSHFCDVLVRCRLY